MYSWFLRFLYSFTYFIHLSIITELYQIFKHRIIPVFDPEQTIVEKIVGVILIHYPIIVFIISLIIAELMVKGAKKLAVLSVQLKSSEPVGIEFLYTGITLVPFIAFAFREHLFGIIGGLVFLIVTVLFLTSHGTFNTSLFFLGYKQYKIKTNNSTIWLVSKRKIYNYSNSELVYTLQDNVFVRHE